MKLKGSKKVHFESGPNMTPLVDVVMVILIFLMLAGGFGAASHFLPWKTSGEAPGPQPPTRLASRLDVYVSSASDDLFRARLSDGQTFTNVESLRAALDAKRKAHEAAGAADESLELTINPRLTTRYQHLAAVYEAAMEAKWGKIGFHPASD